MNIPLQPLRIPGGWLVKFNTLDEVDPADVPRENAWMWFKEDLFLAVHERQNRLVDVGWYPDGDVENGAYRLVVHVGDFRGEELHSFETRDRRVLVAEMERWLAGISDGQT